MLLSRSLKLAVLGIAMLAAGCDRQSGQKAQPEATGSPAQAAAPGTIDTSHKGIAMPDLTLSDAAGRKLALSSLGGKPLLVNLWATWCAPCIAELPQLDALAGEGKVRVLTVSQDMEGGEKIAGFLKQHGVTRLEPWLDPANDLAAHYEANTLPMSVFYDAQGKEVWRTSGPRDWNGAEKKALLAKAE